MQIPNTLPQFLDTKAFIVAIGKEEGVIYRATEGMVEQIERVEEHKPRYSDREGFFFRSGYGIGYSSGAPIEEDKQENIRNFIKAVSGELESALRAERPQLLYLFEPAHLKGRLLKELKPANGLTVHTVQHGMFVNESPIKLLKRVHDYIEGARAQDRNYAEVL